MSFANVSQLALDKVSQIKRWRYILASVIIFSFLFTLSSINRHTDTKWPSSFRSHASEATEHFYDEPPYPITAHALWNDLLRLLEDAAPHTFDKPIVDVGIVSEYFHEAPNVALMDQTQLRPQDILKMARAHHLFTSQLQTRLAPHLARQHAPLTRPARRGIVMVAGGEYMPSAIVSIRMLRRSGSVLPVELWMSSKEEYEPQLCTEILPAFNVTCRLLSDVFHNATVRQSQAIAGFQYKIFALLFSSFDEVLFLDADVVAIRNPDALFESVVFKEKGMITWPDLWATSVSPIYYFITGQTEPPLVGERASTESGQLMVNRRTHLETLLVATYYNYWADWYYVILCQGGYGRGDKSTFLPAALIANQFFHAVSTPTRVIGQQHENLLHSALIQFDPVADYDLHQFRLHNTTTISSPSTIPQPLFLHASDPKFNAARLFTNATDPDTGRTTSHIPTRGVDGNLSWIYTDPKEDVALIPGVERMMWEETRWVACELEGVLSDWWGLEDVCQDVVSYFEVFLDTDEGMEQEARLKGTPRA